MYSRSGFRFSLSKKINACLIFVLTTFAGLAGLQQSRQQHALVETLTRQSDLVVDHLATRMAADRAASERVMQISAADVIAAVAPDMMAADDFPGLQTYADILARTPDIAFVQFIGLNGRVVAEAKASAMAQPDEAAIRQSAIEPATAVIERAIQSNGQQYGTFRMSVTNRRLRLSLEAGKQAANEAIVADSRIAAHSLAQADWTMVLTTLALAAIMAILQCCSGPSSGVHSAILPESC